MTKRTIKIGAILLAVGFAISLGFFVDIIGRIRSVVNDPEIAGNPFVAPPTPLYAPTDPPMPVKIFFPRVDTSPILSAENQTIFRSTELTNRAKQILQRLLDGPISPDFTAPMPKDTKVEQIFISDKGIAFVDFTNSIAANHPGGILGEQATIYAIVNSLTYNLPEIREVKILVGGTEKETLAGHVLLLLPLQMDLTITDIAPPETGTVAQQ